MINIIKILIKYIDKGDRKMITLKQVDEVIERTGASYSEAKAALEETNGDVLEAIIKLENGQGSDEAGDKTNKFNEYTDEFVAKLKELIKLGNVTKISVKKDGKDLINLPITAGAIGALFFTPAIIAGIVTALVTGCTLEITKEDGEVISINEITEETINTLKSKINMNKKENEDTEKEEKKDDLDDLDL